MNEEFLHKKLKEREQQGSLRTLRKLDKKIDFCSNDYLGIVKNNLLNDSAGKEKFKKGSTGSRLLTGNYELIEEAERKIAEFHQTEEALIFNSGYDANLGLLSAVPQRGDTILYDYLSHASIRDGIRLSFAQSFSFQHNNLADLEDQLQKAKGNIFIVTESIFSMDGDIAPLKEITKLSAKYNASLIVDEAHATGIAGIRGEGMIEEMNLQEQCFARLHTFGKALGCHGAAIVCSKTLKQFLVNFARSLIYTTALPENATAAILASYKLFPGMTEERNHLKNLISFFKEIIANSATRGFEVLSSDTPIQGIIVPGNENARALALHIQKNGFDIRPILYPTVAKGTERLRIILHAFNSKAEIEKLATLLL